jgi:hypothetical protein
MRAKRQMANGACLDTIIFDDPPGGHAFVTAAIIPELQLNVTPSKISYNLTQDLWVGTTANPKEKDAVALAHTVLDFDVNIKGEVENPKSN